MKSLTSFLTVDFWRTAAPGLLLAGVISLAARFIAEHYGGPVMLYALLFGIAFNFLAADEKLAPGLAAASSLVLRLGVALLGARITAAQVASLGLSTALLVGGGVIATIIVGSLIGRRFGLTRDHAALSAGAVAICGASAALAIAAILPQHKDSERNTILTVVTVTTLSTAAMVLYPMLIGLLGPSDMEAGVFLGATIHDVAQVVGAGYLFSEPAGETATIVKLMRVACLAPAVLVLSILFRSPDSGAGSARAGLPWFLVAFIIVVALNSFGLLPTPAASAMATSSSWCIVAAVAALGVRTNLKDLVSVGPKPLAAMIAQTVFLAVFALSWILIERALVG